MADRDPNDDPLARLAKPFLGLIGLVWLLAFALLILQLVSKDGEVDGNALILVGILLGIALLPFVSQFSVAGLFEFKREIGQLSDKVDAVRNEVASMSAASAQAQQQTTSSPTAQVILSNPNVAELEDKLAGLQDRLGLAEQGVQGGTATGKNVWHALWFSVELLANLYYFISQVKERGTEVVADATNPRSDTFELAVSELRQSPDLTAAQKSDLEEMLGLNEKVISQDEDEDIEADYLERLSAFVSLLFGKVMLKSVVAEGAFLGLSRIGSGKVVSTIMKDIDEGLKDADANLKALEGEEPEKPRKAITDERESE